MPVLSLSSLMPYHNLAVEEWVLETLPELGPTLLLWRNTPCVVIGRHQNPWVECDLASMKAAGVPLVRRISGGGAVYHDEGNTNFTFLSPSDGYDVDDNLRVVLASLADLGIRADRNARNDLLVNGRKFSGSAYRHTRGRSLHHGTLLVRARLDRLTAYLSGSGRRIQSKATASVRSSVINLAELQPSLTHEAIVSALAARFQSRHGVQDAGPLDDAYVKAQAPRLDARAAELASWEWLYGHTPRFTTTISHDERISLTVVRGIIQAVEGGDATIRDRLTGARYDEASTPEET